MYKLIVLLATFVLYQGQCEEVVPVIPIVSETIALEQNGDFHYSYETGNGIKVHEEGTLKQVDKELVESVSGSFEYPSPDGKKVLVSYTADETGYHPTGDSIPTPPPVPVPIAKALRFLESHPELYVVETEHLK